MKRISRMLVVLCVLILCAGGTVAQTFPTPDYWRGIFVRPQTPQQAGPPEYLREYVVEGKLRLTVADTIRLMLANNTDVQIDKLAYEDSRLGIARAYQAVDPVFTSSFSTTRSTTLTTDQLQGATTLSTLAQNTNANYSQSFWTGTRYSINFNASRNTTNSIFTTFNPSLTSAVNFSITQPLLRNRGLKPNRAPLLIARRNLNQSRAAFEANLNAQIANTVNRYWQVVEARDNLNVQRKSLELAEATYARNKRELELGALPPLDIYRSESQVASRRVQVISAEYALKRAEDDLRRAIGADLDSYIAAMDLELADRAEPTGELLAIDAQEAIRRALEKRPELEALRQQLANDDTNISLAHNALQPSLNLTTFFSSSGRAGNQIDTSVMPPVIIATSGLLTALDQIGAFDSPTYGFNLQLTLPMKNRVAEADMGSALVARRRSLYSQRQSEQGITLETRNAVHTLEEAKLQMAATRIARDLSQKNLEAEQRKYELGAQTIFFVLDAQNQLAVAEQNLLTAQINYQRAVTAVERATSALLERYRVQIR